MHHAYIGAVLLGLLWLAGASLAYKLAFISAIILIVEDIIIHIIQTWKPDFIGPIRRLYGWVRALIVRRY